jgi:2-polyprenyl-3-methyl-5-hydroxy-6-metoxy-1,4-benzoquinol methylase
MLTCKICKSENIFLYHTFKFFPVLGCRECGTLFAEHPPKQERMDEIYGNDYYKGWEGMNNRLTRYTKSMKVYTFSAYFKLFSKFTHMKNKKLLDVGCATGYLLEAAKKMGCDCYGVELSPFGATEASKKFPGRIFNGTLEEARYKSESFDIITLTDLIEHVIDPVEFLKEVKRILKPGGFILIVTPDFHSWWAKFMKNKWTNFKEEHLFYFSSKSLKTLAGIVNLKTLYEKPVSKFLSLEYIYSQFTVFPTPIFYHISRIFPFFPAKIRLTPFPIGTGDILMILKKK